MIPSFQHLEPAYTKLWNELAIKPVHGASVRSDCEKMITHKATYQAVSQEVWATADYWFLVAVLDQMEGGGGAHTHLWNGDPLSAPTFHEPAGEPRVGHGPPFTFFESAVAALRYQGFDKVKSWTPAACGYWFEDWNGWGYLGKKGQNPYLVGWSNQETPGRYVADRVYDANALPGQPGALTLLKMLQSVDPSIKLGYTGSPVSIPTPAKESTMAVDLKQVESVINMISPFAAFIPGAGPWVAVGMTVLKLLEAVEAAPDLSGKLAVVEAHLHDIAVLIGQAKSAVSGNPQTPPATA